MAERAAHIGHDYQGHLALKHLPGVLPGGFDDARRRARFDDLAEEIVTVVRGPGHGGKCGGWRSTSGVVSDVGDAGHGTHGNSFRDGLPPLHRGILRVHPPGSRGEPY
jgi:hypothetical protein